MIPPKKQPMNPDNPRTIDLRPSALADDPFELWVSKPEKGTGVHAATRVSPEMKAMIGDAWQHPKTPWNNEGDLIRAAIYYYMENVVTPRIRDNSITAEMLIISAHERRQKRRADIANLERYQNVAKDILVKQVANGFKGALYEHWRDLLKSSKYYGAEFHNAVRQWMERDPGLARARQIVAEIEASKVEGEA